MDLESEIRLWGTLKVAYQCSFQMWKQREKEEAAFQGHISRGWARLLLWCLWASCAFLAEGCGKLKSSRAGNSDLLLNRDGQRSPQGSPSLHAKPQKALAAGLCYLITFWRLIQWSGNTARQGWGLFVALGFAFPEEAEIDPRKNYWRGNSSQTGTCFFIAGPSVGMANRYHFVD